MTRDPKRWEVGSLFHVADFQVGPPSDPRPWDGGVLTGSGRDALRVIARLGHHRRWWVPSYFCQEVVHAIARAGIELSVYPDSPLSAALDLSVIREEPGDAVLVMNYFGLRTADDLVVPNGFRAAIIEDHTHSPTSAWARSSKADFCIASLRKLYPLADGGAVWSPRGHSLGDLPEVTSTLERGAFRKLSGMLLKRLYLEGHPVTKEEFRPLLESGEHGLLGNTISRVTPLSRATLATFPLEKWDTIQKRNFEALVEKVPEARGFRVLSPRSSATTPFSAFCVFDEVEDCDRAREGLIADRIYPSRLWPLDEPVLAGVPERHARLSRRSFSIPVDMRYQVADMQRVGARLSQLLGL